MSVTTAPAASLPGIKRGQVAAAIGRHARRISARAVSVARKGGATALGAAGLLSGAVGAGAEWGWPVGLMVACPLAVWFASLLPGGDE